MLVFDFVWVSMSTGVIREVAEQMVGGSEKLQAAVKRKAVFVTYGANDTEFYHFPSVEHGSMQKITSRQQIGREKTTTKEAFDAVAGLAETLDWAIVTADGPGHQALSSKKKKNMFLVWGVVLLVAIFVHI